MAILDELITRTHRWGLVYSQGGMTLLPLELVRAVLNRGSENLTNADWMEVYKEFRSNLPDVVQLNIPESELPPTNHAEWVTDPVTDRPLSEVVPVTVYLGAVDSDGNPIHEASPSIEVYVPSDVAESRRQQDARRRVDFEAWAEAVELPLELLNSKSKKAVEEVAAIVSGEPASEAEVAPEGEIAAEGDVSTADEASTEADTEESEAAEISESPNAEAGEEHELVDEHVHVANESETSRPTRRQRNS